MKSIDIIILVIVYAPTFLLPTEKNSREVSLILHFPDLTLAKERKMANLQLQDREILCPLKRYSCDTLLFLARPRT